ncbi:OmpH family outer membrane protein [Rhodobacterales bacterium HKCCE2091]|nr:OmpH family outer membrane protein [Rhodobacterales bacterium HKCCE2091]
MTAPATSISRSRRGSRAALAALMLALAAPAAAQQDPAPAPLTPAQTQAQTPAAPPQDTPSAPAPEGILVLDQDRFFAESAYGRRAQSELDSAGQTLAAENRRIEADLTAEELDLTERRETLPREEFVALAEDFDQRVEQIRSEQDAKARALTAAADAARQRFFELAVPVLLDLVRDRGAAVILDSRTVLLSAETVDITEAAIARIDEALGDGGEEPLIDPAPPGPSPRPEVQQDAPAETPAILP